MTPLLTEIGLYTLSFILLAVGVVGCIMPYPGHLFVLAACAVVPSQGQHYPWWLWLILGVLCVAGFLADNVTTYLGCKKQGASTAAILCSLLGLFIGAFFFPIGLILGPFLGALGAEYLIAKRNLKEGAKVGLGATLGLLAGMLAKLAITGLMVATAATWILCL